MGLYMLANYDKMVVVVVVIHGVVVFHSGWWVTCGPIFVMGYAKVVVCGLRYRCRGRHVIRLGNGLRVPTRFGAYMCVVL